MAQRFIVAVLLAAAIAGPIQAQQPANPLLPQPLPIPAATQPQVQYQQLDFYSGPLRPTTFVRIDPFEMVVLNHLSDHATLKLKIAQVVAPSVQHALTWATTGAEPALPVAPMPKEKRQLRLEFRIELKPLGTPQAQTHEAIQELFGFYVGSCQEFPQVVQATPQALSHFDSIVVAAAQASERATSRGESRLPILPPIRPGMPAPICEDAPSDQEVLAALGKMPRNVPYMFEQYRDNVTIIKNRIVDKIDPPRFYPLVGPAQLHHCHWECIVYYTAKTQSSYPFPVETNKKRVEVVYIDKDVLHLACDNTEPARMRAVRDLTVSGMTLPSGQYLQHTPQAIPPSPSYPTLREPVQSPQPEWLGRVYLLNRVFAQPEDPNHPLQRVGVDFNLPAPVCQPTPIAVGQLQLPASQYVPYPAVPPMVCPDPCYPSRYVPPPPPVLYQTVRPVPLPTPCPGLVCPPPPPSLQTQQLLPPQQYVNTWNPPQPQSGVQGWTCPPQSLIPVAYATVPASRTVSLKDVVELVQVGTGDEVIINQMRNTNSKYSLSVADIKFLKAGGVSDRVIIEMQGCTQAPSGCPLPCVPPTVNPPVTSYSIPR